MKKLLLVAALATMAWVAADGLDRNRGPAPATPAVPGQADVAQDAGDTLLADAYDRRRSNLQVEGSGTVARLLADDIDGSRHQRFILRLGSGQTLLVAHNIDLAPRIDGLAVGDTVAFSGEYEWSERGGVVHWTHHDPDGSHVGGWLRHDGRTFQ